MNFQEMLYKSLVFIFSNFWTYIGFAFLIIVIRGDVSRGIISVKEFVKNTRKNYNERKLAEKNYYSAKEKIKI